MKYFAIFTFFFVAFMALTQAYITDEEYSALEDAGGQSEAVELWSGNARQRICTAPLCRSLCQALGFPRGACNAQLLCVCRR